MFVTFRQESEVDYLCWSKMAARRYQQNQAEPQRQEESPQSQEEQEVVNRRTYHGVEIFALIGAGLCMGMAVVLLVYPLTPHAAKIVEQQTQEPTEESSIAPVATAILAGIFVCTTILNCFLYFSTRQ